MPHKVRQFVNGEIYHIVIRRMGEEKLFLDIDDYYRGIFCIYEFNTTKPITIRERRALRKRFKKAIREEIPRGSPPVTVVKRDETMVFKDERDLLVEVLAFCLMPNHIHLLLRQLKTGGISNFMLKVESGYASYFKRKYGTKIKGHFFQDRFSVTPIKNDTQLRVVFTYIHTNPTSCVEPGWKEKGVKDPEKVIKFLEEYKWSSYQDYLGKKNFPSVTERKFVLEVIGGKEGCQEWVENWVRYKREVRKLIEKFKRLSLEK